MRATPGMRCGAAVLAIACLVVLALAAWTSPDARGIGTHTQLGLPACGWLMRYGKPCATCGMTTSFAHAANADFLGALRTQPMGAVLCVITASVFWASLHMALTGARWDFLASRLARPPAFALLVAGILAGWAYKIVTHE